MKIKKIQSNLTAQVKVKKMKEHFKIYLSTLLGSLVDFFYNFKRVEFLRWK
jgi:hypothetical protein